MGVLALRIEVQGLNLPTREELGNHTPGNPKKDLNDEGIPDYIQSMAQGRYLAPTDPELPVSRLTRKALEVAGGTGG